MFAGTPLSHHSGIAADFKYYDRPRLKAEPVADVGWNGHLTLGRNSTFHTFNVNRKESNVKDVLSGVGGRGDSECYERKRRDEATS